MYSAGSRRRSTRRRADTRMTVLVWLAAALALLPLAAILTHIVVRGVGGLSPAFFVQLPAPAGIAGGGMANAIVGTLLLLAVAAAVGIPVGIGAGLYLAANARTRTARTIRFLADVMSGLPSIVVGVFVWQLVVRPTQQFSGFAGGIALGVLIIPVVTRATEELVKLVPVALAESALALGFTEWRTGLRVVLRAALPGILTAALVALARAAGETAPLLLTAFGNPYWNTDLTQPIAALPLQVYAYAGSAYSDWRQQAWAGALLLLIIVALMNVLARTALRRRLQLFRAESPRAGIAP